MNDEIGPRERAVREVWEAKMARAVAARVEKSTPRKQAKSRNDED